MKEYKPIETLEQIKRVDVPPQLFSKIQTKIALEKNKISITKVLIISILFMAMILLNAFFISSKMKSKKPADNEIQIFAKEMHLNQSNQLYYE